MRRKKRKIGVARGDRIKRFQSVAAFLDDATVQSEQFEESSNWIGNEFAGGTLDDAFRYARNGDLSSIADAQKLAERIDNSLDVAGEQVVLEPAVCGFAPIVPAYLAGEPESMLMQHETSARGEIEIWECLSIPGYVKPEDMRRKGVILLATVLALSRIANVKVVAYTSSVGANPAIEMSTPIDVSELCAVFCQPCFMRKLTLPWRYCENKSLDTSPAGWSVKWCHDTAIERDALIKLAGMNPNALVFGNDERFYQSDEEIICGLNATVAEYKEKFQVR